MWHPPAGLRGTTAQRTTYEATRLPERGTTRRTSARDLHSALKRRASAQQTVVARCSAASRHATGAAAPFCCPSPSREGGVCVGLWAPQPRSASADAERGRRRSAAQWWRGQHSRRRQRQRRGGRSTPARAPPHAEQRVAGRVVRRQLRSGGGAAGGGAGGGGAAVAADGCAARGQRRAANTVRASRRRRLAASAHRLAADARSRGGRVAHRDSGHAGRRRAKPPVVWDQQRRGAGTSSGPRTDACLSAQPPWPRGRTAAPPR